MSDGNSNTNDEKTAVGGSSARKTTKKVASTRGKTTKKSTKAKTPTKRTNKSTPAQKRPAASGARMDHSSDRSFGKLLVGGFGVAAAIGTVFTLGVYISSLSAPPPGVETDALVKEKGQLAIALGKKIEEIDQLTSERDDARGQLEQFGVSPKDRAIKQYLFNVLTERQAKWGHKFEQQYSTGTLFLLKPKATHHDRVRNNNLMGVYGRILRWRLGLDDLPPKDKCFLSLTTGYIHGAEPLRGETPEEYIASRVDRLILDKDLLNCEITVADSNVEEKGIAILGEPASGKSTLLEYLELLAARRALSDPQEPLPVRIELGDLASQADNEHSELSLALIWSSLHETMKHYVKDMDLAAHVPGTDGEFNLPGRRYILLIDALDEAWSIESAARVIAELSTDEKVARIIVTSRIINYDVNLFRQQRSLTDHGFRTALLYGQSLAAIEKRILSIDDRDQRDAMLSVMSKADRRPVWLQFFRLPVNFNFAKDFLLSTTDIEELATSNRTELLGFYIEKMMERVRVEYRDEGKTPPKTDDVDRLLSFIAGWVFANPKRSVNSFSDYDVRQAVQEFGDVEIDEEMEETLLAQLDFATKVGVIEKVEEKEEWDFRHRQYLEYYASRAPHNWASSQDVFVPRWIEVVVFKSGQRSEEAKQLVRRIAAEAISRYRDDRHDDYLVDLAIRCIDNGPNEADPEFSQLMKELSALREPAPESR